MAINWNERTDVEGLPVFVVAALARYEDGIKTELNAQMAVAADYEEVEAAKDYAECARAELVSLLDYLVGRLEAVTE